MDIEYRRHIAGISQTYRRHIAGIQKKRRKRGLFGDLRGTWKKEWVTQNALPIQKNEKFLLVYILFVEGDFYEKNSDKNNCNYASDKGGFGKHVKQLNIGKSKSGKE